MKKIKAVILSLIVFILGISQVSAACDLEETNKLKGLASNVKVNYEVTEIEEDPNNYDAPDIGSEEENVKVMKSIMNIRISNLTKELYVTVEDSLSKSKKTYNYNNAKDGIITIVQEDLTAINNYVVTVYSSSETNCANTKLFTAKLTTPYYNYYSDMAICEGIEDFYLCHNYLSVESVGFEEFIELAQKYKKGKVDKTGEELPEKPVEKKGFLDFIKDNKGIVIITVILVIAVGGLVTYTVIKKQKRSR